MIYTAAAAAIVLLILLLRMEKARVFTGIGCIFYRITGLYCPGCGMTRAFKALLSGKLIESMRFNPAAVYIAGFTVIYMTLNTVKYITKGRFRGMKYRNLYLYLAIAIMVLQCIVRNTAGIFF